jgi:Fe2+ transport system protein FeoA
LSDIPAGARFTIRRLHEFGEANAELLKFLLENGITPGVEATLVDVLPFNQTLTLLVGDQRVVLGIPAARYLFGERI